ncbi:MAG: hypothetical protein Q9196_002443 [Gyalolechia fulgens]
MFQERYGRIAPTETRFEELKHHYRNLRDDFRANPRSSVELDAWKEQDNDFNYELLESPRSYIIGNLASSDGRQYPDAPPDRRPEGQGFAHTLVIPKARVYNVVDPDATAHDCALLREMRAHFVHFWSRDDGPAKMLARARLAMEDQDRTLLARPDPSPAARLYRDTGRGDVFRAFDDQAPVFARLQAEDDFLFGFHVFPNNSIGHLHMHVFPHADRLREWSTKEYDWKTVPLQAVLEVETEDREVGRG